MSGNITAEPRNEPICRGRRLLLHYTNYGSWNFDRRRIVNLTWMKTPHQKSQCSDLPPPLSRREDAKVVRRNECRPAATTTDSTCRGRGCAYFHAKIHCHYRLKEFAKITYKRLLNTSNCSFSFSKTIKLGCGGKMTITQYQQNSHVHFNIDEPLKTSNWPRILLLPSVTRRDIRDWEGRDRRWTPSSLLREQSDQRGWPENWREGD